MQIQWKCLALLLTRWKGVENVSSSEPTGVLIPHGPLSGVLLQGQLWEPDPGAWGGGNESTAFHGQQQEAALSCGLCDPEHADSSWGTWQPAPCQQRREPTNTRKRPTAAHNSTQMTPSRDPKEN